MVFRSFVGIALILACVLPLCAQTPVAKQQEKRQVPFTPFGRHGAPVIRIRVNDVTEGMFLVDTGSEYTFFLRSSLTKFHLKGEPATEGMPSIFNSNMVVKVSNFKIGQFNLPSTYAVVSDQEMSDFNNIDGVLGMDVLSLFAVALDFDTQQMTLLYPGTLSSQDCLEAGFPQTITPVTLSRYNGRLTFSLPLTVKKDKRTVSMAALLDTGSTNTQLSNESAGLLGPKPFGQTYVRGPKSGEDLDLYESYNVWLGGLNLRSGYYSITHTNKSYYDARIGMSVLSTLSVLIDFPAKRLYVKPGTITNPSFLANRQYFIAGVTFGPTVGKAWTVQAVDADSPAQKSGIQVGDEVIRINGYLSRERPWLTHRPEFKEATAFIFDVWRGGEEKPLRFVVK